jgi:hypothetical protein
MAEGRMSVADQPRSDSVIHKPPIVAGRDAGPVDDFEALLGTGNDLWADDAEFEAFLTALQRWRKHDRDEIRVPSVT